MASQYKHGEPIMPSNPQNPVGGTTLITEARRETDRKLKEIQRWLADTVKAIPTQVRTINMSAGPLVGNASFYDYQISTFALEMIVAELKQRLSNPEVAEPIVNRAGAAYEVGTASAVKGLAALTDQYTRTITQVLASDPWQRRSALIRARVFEQMEGFAGETAADLSRVLMTGIENGKNPLALVDDLSARFKVSRTRAERIARTEITGSLRRARWDEADEAAANVGVRTKEMHLSALSPTTRVTHAERHGRLYTTEEVRQWYTEAANAINCKCTQVSVLVNEDGSPVISRSVTRAEEQRKRYIEEASKT